MPTDPTLRHLFSAPQPPSTIDVAAVVRRSRARRLPKVLGATGIGVLAIAGIVVGGLQLGGAPSPESDAAGSAPTTLELESDGAQSLMDSTKRAPAEKLNLCGGPVSEVDSSATGLVLSVSFADAPASAASVEGTVTMTNTGVDAVTGYTAASPAITLARDGLVIWHSNGPMIDLAREVSLAPGESMDYTASFTPVVCGVEDDEAESFRDDLPAAPVGEYQVSAAIDVMGEFDALLVSGPAQTITLR